MALKKDAYPILERDTEQTAVIMPNRKKQYILPIKCVFAFLKTLLTIMLFKTTAKK